MSRAPFAKLASMAALLALAACNDGKAPVASLPAPPPPRTPERFAAPGVAEQTTVPALVPERWWESFGNAKLNALVDAALAHNADLATAEASLKQARALAGAAAAATGPQVDASYGAQRSQISSALSAPLADSNTYIYTLHTAQLTVSYPLDVFGAGRAKVASARAAASVAQARYQAARTTLVANLVLATIQHASLAAQVDAASQAIAATRELLSLTQRRRALGEASATDVAAAEAALATAQATLPALERARQHQAALIGSLVGVAAGSAPMGDLPHLADIALPASLPVALPAAIIAHRPDVRAAEAQMRGAAADLGAATAARLPAIALTGSAGGSAERIASLFAQPYQLFSLAGTVTQPVFHSGALLRQQRAARSALAAAQAQYRSAVLQAYLDVDDALAGLRTDAAALEAAQRGARAAQEAFVLGQRQQHLGALGNYGLLGLAASAAQARALAVQAQASRLSDTVGLYVACGTLPTPPNTP
jgi:NodT family efflux transporter outer membrane factor (OMF) lipoprotein